MLTSRSLRIVEENLKLHRFEARFYEVQHPEIYNFFEQLRIKREMFLLRREFRVSDAWCLDVGSGTGNLAYHLASADFKVVACDISVPMLKRNMAEYKIVCEAASLPFICNIFTALTAYAVFHHLPKPYHALQEFVRVSSFPSVLYFDRDLFIRNTNVVPRNIKAVHLLPFFLWLISRPQMAKQFVEYLLLGRKLHNKSLANVNWYLTDRNLPKLDQVIQLLHWRNYDVKIHHYRHGATLKATRK
jgi:SAM-dependent methyltransferase